MDELIDKIIEFISIWLPFPDKTNEDKKPNYNYDKRLFIILFISILIVIVVLTLIAIKLLS